MPRIEPFEKYTKEYEEWFEKNRFVYKSELQAIKRLLPLNGEGIEIGVGSGCFAAPLGIKLGVEPSYKMRQIAQSRGIEVIDGIAESLPINADQFNFALMVTTICFLDDLKAAFKEVFRILKPSGYFLIGFIDKESLIGRQYQKYKNENVFYRIATFFSVDEIAKHLKLTGFDSFHINQTIFQDLSEIKKIEPIKMWYGEGSFVVIRAQKKHKVQDGFIYGGNKKNIHTQVN